MITIVNYKMGNIRSVQNALAYLGKDSRVSSDPKIIAAGEKLILPGVGSFRTAMQNLHDLGIVEALQEAVVVKGRPVLGICLGMQLLAQEGTEDGLSAGLGWIPGQVVRFEPADPSCRVPHIGFNSVRFVQDGNVLFRSMGEHADFYFVHSYHFSCSDTGHVSGWSEYGGPFVASVQRGNIFGTQFHPEKSQSNGLKVLSNFLRI